MRRNHPLGQAIRALGTDQTGNLHALGHAGFPWGCKDLSVKARCRGYAGVTRLAPHVIQLKGPYDIAVEPAKENDGSYGLTTDWWDGHVAKEVGTVYGRLLQSYCIHKTMREARNRGLRVQRRQEQDGSVLLTLEGGAL